jgi:aldose sugar dehydrogenase
MKRALVGIGLLGCLAAACVPGREEGSVLPEAPQGRDAGYRVETVASNLEVPWSIAFAPDGRIIFTERPGRIRVISNGKLVSKPLHTFSDVEQTGESGLMGLVLHPKFAQNHLLYASYAYRRDAVRVVQFKETNGALTNRRVILEGIPAAQFHAGCRLKFGPDGKLYITTGDATDRRIAQQLNSLGGKILRVNDDGSIPSDNPFVGRPNARPEIWAYGSRNAQGIDWQPGTGTLFDTEHGPSGFDGPGGGDEVNIVEKGANLGWPTIHHKDTQAGLVSPLLEYTPAVAPASAAFYNGSALPGYKGNFFFGCLRGTAIIRVVLDGKKVVRQERMITNLGRIREVAAGPDGYLYFSTSNHDGRGSPANNDDRIMRIVPATGRS